MTNTDFWRRELLVGSLLCAIALIWGCAEAREPGSADEKYGSPESKPIKEPVEFTDQSYDFQGETSIQALKDLAPSTNVWYGAAPDMRYPRGAERIIDDDCDAGFFTNNFNGVEELPTTIEGRVTYEPTKFEKPTICGQDQYYEGSYIIEDSTGGILVMKNSMISDLEFGDQVRLKVRGMMKFFDTRALLIHEREEITETKEPINYREINRAFQEDDLGHVRRITGTITTMPTNENFNAMELQNESGTTWAVSLNRDFGLRPVPFQEGDRLQLTGPVLKSFGTRQMLIRAYGQIEWLNRNPYSHQ